MRKDDNKEKEKKNEIVVFTNKDFGSVRMIYIDGEPYFVGKDIAEILGYSNSRKALLDHVDEDDKTDGVTIRDSIGREQTPVLINESGLYSLILSSKLPSAKRFKRWVTSEILPTIRKTGGYVNNENLFVDTYLPFADENTKLLFSTTLETIRQQNELISKQQKEISYKQDLINGLTEDLPIYEKADIINRICKRAYGGYANRYKELYKCFRENYHIDLIKRCQNYNDEQLKKKDELTIIRYAEKFGFIDDLYSCCVKLYETEIKEILEQLNEVQS